jgi:hypothetical protein
MRLPQAKYGKLPAILLLLTFDSSLFDLWLQKANPNPPRLPNLL